MDGLIRVLDVGVEPDCSAFPTDTEGGRFAVDTVAEPSTALDRLTGGVYDCVLSAYELPGSTGVEFLRTVRETDPAIPFVLYPDDGSEEIASEAITAGVTEYIDDQASLKQRLERVVGGDGAVSSDRLRRLDRLVETVPTAILRVDRSAEIVFANERARSLLGFDTEAPIQRTWTDDEWDVRDLDGEPIPDSALPVTRVLRSGDPVEAARHSLRCPDGVRRTVEIDAAPLYDGGGAIEGVVFALTDITEQGRRERAFAALHDIATTIQGEKTVEAVCERTVRAATDILEFETCSILVRDGDWLVPRAASENTQPGGVRRMRTDQGVAGRVFQSGDPDITRDIADEKGADPAKESYRSAISVPVGEYGVFQAVSTEPEAFDEEDVEFAELLVSHAASRIEQIEREEELRRQNERLDEFAGIVSHDLSNPLNVAQLQLELARESCDTDRLDAVARAHDRMEALIDTLLTLARSREPVEEPEPVNLGTVAQICLETLDTDVVRLVAEDGAIVRADRELVQILLENLLKNSAEHGHPDTSDDAGADGDGRTADQVTVRIGLLDHDGFFVEDDGPGIPEDIRADVFDSGFSTASDGTGFGLEIVTEIVDAHGWQITATESDSGGARFEITGVETGG